MAMERHSLRFPRDVWMHLEEEAAYFGISPSEFVRISMAVMVSLSRSQRGLQPERTVVEVIEELERRRP